MMLEHTAESSKTVIRQIDPMKLSALRNWVVDAIQRLQWRQSGLGMLQAYVLQGSEQEVRVHIWHPSIKLPGIDEAGLGHDHRFDMTSWVLVGRLTHVEVLTTA